MAVLIVLAPALLGACAPPSAAQRLGRLVDLGFTVDGQERVAAVYVPAGYDTSSDRWPLILFLHGIGERGDDGRAQTQALWPVIQEHPERFPCLVLMPQCPEDRVWAAIDAPWARGFPPAETHIDAALAAMLSSYRIDPQRMSLTGLSMGGFGALAYGARHRQRFAALVALCGGGRAGDAAALADTPLWLVHGALDQVVPEQASLDFVAAVRAAGGEPRFTSHPDLAHNVWDRAYRDPELIAFLLGAQRAGAVKR